MLSVKEAQQRILSFFSPTDTIQIPLAQSAGRVLAQDCFAIIDLPPFNNSGMDGFAVVARDTFKATPQNNIHLTVTADIPAGSSSSIIISNGQAARIMTGAPIPPGADAVVMIEETDCNTLTPGEFAPSQVAIHHPVNIGTNIRKKGEDIQTGQKIITKGSSLRPQDLGLLAMQGMAFVPVHRKPRLALLSCGDELISVDTPMTQGRIRDANMYTLSASAKQSSITPSASYLGTNNMCP